MGRFTNPRDLYLGEGARHEVKNLKGSRAVIVSGGSSMRRGADQIGRASCRERV